MKIKNTKFNCRLCGSSRVKSLIDLDGFPKAAQHFISSIDDPEPDDPITLMVCQCDDWCRRW